MRPDVTGRLAAFMGGIPRVPEALRITDRVIRPLRVETTPDRAILYVYDYIGPYGTEAEPFARAVAAATAPVIEVRVNSPGGDFFDAVAMYTALVRSPARVDVTVDGVAASAASFLAMAGDRVSALPPAKMMIHDALTITYGNEAEHLTSARLLSEVSDTIAELYAGRAGGDPAGWRETMRVGRWYTASEALDAGLIDAVDQAATTDPGASDARTQAIRARARQRGVRT